MTVATEPSPRPTKPEPAAPPSRGVVLDLYDLLRAARFNVLYYGRKLWWLQFWAVTFDVVIAVGTSSAVASLAFWSATGVKTVPLALGAVAALLSVVKPTLALPKRVERVSGLWSGYLGVFQTADQIARAVRTDEAMTNRQRTLLGNLHDRMDAFEKNDDPSPDSAKLADLQRQVNDEIPIDDWWVPAAT